MSEALDIVNLILGIIGTVTGSIAVVIHFWRLRKENPRIKVKVLKCEHDFEQRRNQISFWAEFQIKNLGDRGTSINDVDLVFISDNREHLLRRQYFRGPTETSERRWINPHETIDLETDFWEEYQGEVKENINCTFSLYHTHGKETVKITSRKRTVVIEEI
jgi:hypothetical protein